MSYPYTDEDRIATPHRYMYTTYEGASLLVSFEEDRRETMADLMLRLPKNPSDALDVAACAQGLLGQPLRVERAALEAVLRPLTAGREHSACASPVGSPDPWRTDSVEAVPTLSALFARLCTTETEGLRAASDALDPFLRRFEITKAVHERYDGATTRGIGDHQDVQPYALLAACLGAAAVRDGSLRTLNALLKVCDTLSSVRGRLDVDQAALAYVAMACESVSVDSVASNKGVAW